MNHSSPHAVPSIYLTLTLLFAVPNKFSGMGSGGVITPNFL